MDSAGNVSWAIAMKQTYNTEPLTIYNFAPEDIRSFLHPHWHNQKAPHQLFYFVCAIFYSVVGNYRYLSTQLNGKCINQK